MLLQWVGIFLLCCSCISKTMDQRASIDGDFTPKSIDEIICLIVELCNLDSENITERTIKSQLPYDKKDELYALIYEYNIAFQKSENYCHVYINHEQIIATIKRLLECDDEVIHFTEINNPEEDQEFVFV